MSDTNKTPAAAGTIAGASTNLTSVEGEKSTPPARCQVLEITRQEYDILRDKAMRYDMLRKIAVKGRFVTDTEAIIFDLEKEHETV